MASARDPQLSGRSPSGVAQDPHPERENGTRIEAGRRSERVGCGMRIATLGTLWRGLLVGIAYFFLLSVGGAIVAGLGAPLPEVEDSSALLPWILSSGILIGVALGAVARHIPASFRRQAVIWFCLLFLNSLSVLVEALFFVPEQVSAESFSYLALQQLLTSAGTAVVVARLFTRRGAVSPPAALARRPWQGWLWRFAAGALFYVLLFFVVGGLNYELFTRPYYEELGGLATPEGPVVLAVESVRGVLIVLSILPLILTYQTTRRSLMISAGLLLFVVGGAAPLALQATVLPGFLLLASGWEIFLQLVPTGAVTAALLMPSPLAERG